MLVTSWDAQSKAREVVSREQERPQACGSIRFWKVSRTL